METITATEMQKRIFKIMKGGVPYIIRNKDVTAFFLPDSLLYQEVRVQIAQVMDKVIVEQRRRAALAKAPAPVVTPE